MSISRSPIKKWQPSRDISGQLKMKPPLLSPRKANKPINPFLTALAASSRQMGVTRDTPIDPPGGHGSWSHDSRSHDPRSQAIPIPNIENKSLHLKGVPDDLNNEQHLLNHFSKYGAVDKVECAISKKYADVHFKTREAAVLAKKQGGVLSPNTRPVTIFWYSAKATTARKPRNDDADYDPCAEDDEGQDDDDYNDNEVVNEGADSVLLENRHHDDNAMDTIARTANHPYYLRSLHQPEKDFADTTDDTINSYQRYNIKPLVLPPVPSVKGFASAVECFEVLDQRDKMIRKSLIKETSLKAEVIAGTCPDMCPEKERYEREYQRRLSSFEVSSEGGVDHAKAVKEYSRSAADKEEPLPHELRPLPVLLMTMDYLCTCIVDQIEDSNDCYQFVWDRTRAITTDITYQQLCEIDCVFIIERCVRFHILCRFILCERDVQSFDPKMNDESLARHLQSLRQLYKDLKTATHKDLRNEPEMCSYDILLHCTDGNVLNKIEGYSQSVRQSPPVLFAIKIVQAIESNNFVKFFKLVKRSDFLSACLLHRYFNTIRTRALKTLNNSHSPGVDKPMHFSLSDLSRILGFASRDEGAMFCQEAGLHVSREKVQFQRGTEVTPPTSITRDDTVLMKNDQSFAEVVYGGPLPPIPDHTPYCSFTAKNSQVPNVDMPPAPTVEDTPPINIEEILPEIVENIVIDGVSGEVPLIVDDVIHTLITSDIIESLTENIINHSVGVALKEIAQMVILEELNKREKQEMNEIKDITADQISLLYLEDIVWESCNAVAMETIVDRNQLILKCAGDVMEVLVEDTVRASVIETAVDMMKVLKSEKKSHLNHLRKEFDTKQLGKYWNRWRKASERQYIINTVTQFPPSAPRLPLHDQLVLMNNTTPLSNKPDHDPYSKPTPHHDDVSTIDVNSLLLTHLPLPDTSLKDAVLVYWNILVITDTANQYSLMWAWLKEKLNINSLNSHPLNTFKAIINIKFCLYNEVPSLNDEFFDVPVVVMATVPMPQANELPQQYCDHVIKSLPTLCQDYPTIILTPYKLSFLYTVQLLKDIDHYHSPMNVSGLLYKEIELKKCLVWLIQNSPKPSVSIVEWTDVHQYLYNGISSRFYQYVVPELNLVSLNHRPDIIVGFYNDILMHLVKQIEVGVVTVSMASSVNNTRYSSWKRPISDLSQLLVGLYNLQLPSINSLSCVNYINNFTISDTVSRTRLLSLLTINNHHTVSPWIHVLLICTELLLLSTKETYSNIRIGVPVGDHAPSPDDHAPLHWIHEILTCDSMVDSRKRRRSEPPTGLISSAPPTKAPSILSSSFHSLSSSLEREKQLDNEYEQQLKHWSQGPHMATPIHDTPTVNTISTQNEKWLNTVTNMKLKVLQTQFVRDPNNF